MAELTDETLFDTLMGLHPSERQIEAMQKVREDIERRKHGLPPRTHGRRSKNAEKRKKQG